MGGMGRYRESVIILTFSDCVLSHVVLLLCTIAAINLTLC